MLLAWKPIHSSIAAEQLSAGKQRNMIGGVSRQTDDLKREIGRLKGRGVNRNQPL